MVIKLGTSCTRIWSGLDVRLGEGPWDEVSGKATCEVNCLSRWKSKNKGG